MEIRQLFGHCGIQGNHCARTVGFRPDGAELEPVTRERERRGAVAVRVIEQDIGYLGNIQLHAVLSSQAHQFVGGTFFHVVEHLAQLSSQERRDDGRRCFVGSQTMSIRGTHDRSFKQTVVAIDSHQGIDHKRNETKVFFGGLSRSHQQDARIGSQ